MGEETKIEAEMIEAMARAICADDGFDQDAEDELAPRMSNGRRFPHWVRYEDNAKAVLATLRPYFATIRRRALVEAASICDARQIVYEGRAVGNVDAKGLEIAACVAGAYETAAQLIRTLIDQPERPA